MLLAYNSAPKKSRLGVGHQHEGKPALLVVDLTYREACAVHRDEPFRDDISHQILRHVDLYQTVKHSHGELDISALAQSGTSMSHVYYRNIKGCVTSQKKRK